VVVMAITISEINATRNMVTNKEVAAAVAATIVTIATMVEAENSKRRGTNYPI
jgi:hypothetical protein